MWSEPAKLRAYVKGLLGVRDLRVTEKMKQAKIIAQEKNRFLYVVIMNSATKSASGPMGDHERTAQAGKSRLYIIYKLFLLLIFKGVFKFWTFDLTIIISLNCIIIE